MRKTSRRQQQRGFLIIAAVFLLVVLAGLVAYLTTVSTTSQAASAADFNSARAYQAARAGIEWGAYQIVRNPGGTFKTNCDAANNPLVPEKFDLTFGSTLTAFTATVRCSSSVDLTEGTVTNLKSYRIESNGCNEPTGAGPSCPNVLTTSATYAERELRLSLTN